MLLSMHIPKTAGTSFRMALQECLGDTMLLAYRGRIAGPDVVCHFHGRLLETLDPGEADRLLDYCDDKDVRCIHGHFAMAPLHELFPDAPCITFIREPVGRLVSAYNHMWVTMPDAARRTSFEAFVRNERTQNVYEQLGIVDYLDNMAFIGVMEEYGRSLQLLERTMPELGTLAIEQANVSKEKRFTRDDIDPAFFDELYDLNQADIDIYDTVASWFQDECEAHGI